MVTNIRGYNEVRSYCRQPKAKVRRGRRIRLNRVQVNTTLAFYKGRGEDYLEDTFMDLYNNHIGRQIGLYALQNGLTNEEVEWLVLDAVKTGQLAMYTDQREVVVPPVKRGWVDETGNDDAWHQPGWSGWTGWPRQFDEQFTPGPEAWTPPVGEVTEYTPLWNAADVQMMLNRFGANVKVDGWWGEETRGALMQFQQDHGLEPNGWMDEPTIEELLVRGGWYNLD